MGIAILRHFFTKNIVHIEQDLFFDPQKLFFVALQNLPNPLVDSQTDLRYKCTGKGIMFESNYVMHVQIFKKGVSKFKKPQFRMI